MAKKPESKLMTGALPKTVRAANTGPIDPAFLERPRPEQWNGWASAPQGDDRNP